MASRLQVSLTKAVDPQVLAVDVGSTASRGDVYDATGRPLDRGSRPDEKVPHDFTARADGTSEIDPDQVDAEIEEILAAQADGPVAGRLGGVALDTFASSLVGVGPDGRARTRASPTPTPGAAGRSATCAVSWTRPRRSSGPAAGSI